MQRDRDNNYQLSASEMFVVGSALDYIADGAQSNIFSAEEARESGLNFRGYMLEQQLAGSGEFTLSAEVARLSMAAVEETLRYHDPLAQILAAGMVAEYQRLQVQ